MTGPHGRRIARALLLGLLPALVVGGALFLRDARPAAPPPAPTASAVVRATAAETATPAATPQAPPLAATATPVPGLSPPSVAAASPAPAAPAWVEVGRWRDGQLRVTEAFTVRGPWRIRWRLDSPAEAFQLMIEEGDATPVLLNGAPGATAGVFDEARPGTFSLMLHNGIPYEVVVEAWQAP